MVDFNTLHTDFETTKDFSGFPKRYAEGNTGIRYLLLRSLDTNHLKELMKNKSCSFKNGRFLKLLEQAYDSEITVDDVVEYIESKRAEIDESRNIAEEGLDELIKNYGPVNCGVRNDKVDDIVKTLVRDKTIKTIDELKDRIENEFFPRIKNYILWSFYNQTTNDLIEHFFIKHQKIVPTLRKIHHIDFFLKLDDAIIPFDLKITHISDDFFDLYSQGLIRTSDEADDFSIDSNNKTEIEEIKDFYKSKKKPLALPNYGQLSKMEMLEVLSLAEDEETQKFVGRIYQKRMELISNILNDLDQLEWWNYKYQGERLFSNNNRLFVFLVYTNAFEDGRPIKGQLDLIQEKVNSLLDNIQLDSINTIKYHYDKDASLVGDYESSSISILIETEKNNDVS